MKIVDLLIVHWFPASLIFTCLAILIWWWMWGRKFWLTGYVSHIESGSASLVLYDWWGKESTILIEISKLEKFGVTHKGQEFRMWVGLRGDEPVYRFYPLKRKAVSKEQIDRVIKKARDDSRR